MSTKKEDELALRSSDNQVSENKTAYTPSDSVTQAQQALKAQLAQKPGSYQSAWQTQLNDTIQKILNREPFEYDMNADALYQQYKDSYIQQGKQAMMDTMGQAASLTGGYGNSYAQMAGQQAYQGYLQGLNDKIPELYQLALSKYQAEGDQLSSQYGILSSQESMDYGKHQDAVNNWLTEREYLTDRADTERNYDYSLWADDRDFAYQQERDEAADQKWQAEFDEALRQWEFANADKVGSSGGATPAGGTEDEEDGPLRKYLATNGEILNATGMVTDQDGNQIADPEKLVYSPPDTVAGFIRQVDDTYQMEVSKGNEDAYKNRILSTAYSRYENGRLSESDLAYIMNYYNLWDKAQ